MGWMGFGNFNDTGNLLVVTGRISGVHKGLTLGNVSIYDSRLCRRH